MDVDPEISPPQLQSRETDASCHHPGTQSQHGSRNLKSIHYKKKPEKSHPVWHSTCIANKSLRLPLGFTCAVTEMVVTGPSRGFKIQSRDTAKLPVCRGMCGAGCCQPLGMLPLPKADPDVLLRLGPSLSALQALEKLQDFGSNFKG